MPNKKAVYFFCKDLKKDPVAFNVFKSAFKNFDLNKTEILVDNEFVLEYRDCNNNIFQYVRTDEVISHNYEKYLPIMRKYFSNFDFAGLVNWHEGGNSPDKVLTVHTTGDVPTGKFGMANPIYTRNLVCAIEENRVELGLEDFSTVTEATHWSGVPYGGDPNLIMEFNVPLVDIEIGSTRESWENEKAIEVLAKSLVQVFNSEENVKSLLCVGGVHFESAFSKAILDKENPIAITHILPNQWIVTGNYDTEEGAEKIETCIKTIIGGVDGIVFHDNLKSVYKNKCKEVGEKLGIPVFKHKTLKK